MAYIQLLTILFPFLFADQGEAPRSQPLPKKNWKLVWSDEFNYRGLPDDTKWSYESGFVRGVEKQFYTAKRSENTYVRNGFLTIVAKKESYRNPKFKRTALDNSEYRLKHLDSLPISVKNMRDSVVNYTSGSLTTLGKFSWKYGKIEIRAKMPRGSGVWPAIWMMGVNRSEVGWPRCGEIDIVEFLGRKPNGFYSSAHHLDAQTGKKRSYSFYNEVKNPPYKAFHKYGIEWNEKEIVFFFDGVQYHSIQNSSETFKKPFYLLINLALGGKFGGDLDERTLPQKFVIDYVRVYQ